MCNAIQNQVQKKQWEDSNTAGESFLATNPYDLTDGIKHEAIL